MWLGSDAQKRKRAGDTAALCRRQKQGTRLLVVASPWGVEPDDRTGVMAGQLPVVAPVLHLRA
jgi:hypothetical protein